MDNLIEKVKKGDLEAFEELVHLYEVRAINFAYRMLKDSHDAEDAVQEAFLKVFDKIHTFHQKSSFSTWFFTILNNVCLDALRKKSKAPAQVSINQQSDEEDEYELPIEDTTPGPYEAFQKKDAMKALDAALSQLSDEHRAVIVLRDINGMEYENIAKVLDVSLGTVKSRLSRARQALGKLLEENKELFL